MTLITPDRPVTAVVLGATTQAELGDHLTDFLAMDDAFELVSVSLSTAVTDVLDAPRHSPLSHPGSLAAGKLETTGVGFYALVLVRVAAPEAS